MKLLRTDAPQWLQTELERGPISFVMWEADSREAEAGKELAQPLDLEHCQADFRKENALIPLSCRLKPTLLVAISESGPVVLWFHAEVSLLTFQVVNSQVRCPFHQAPWTCKTWLIFRINSALAYQKIQGVAMYFILFSYIRAERSHLISIPLVEALGKHLNANLYITLHPCHEGGRAGLTGKQEDGFVSLGFVTRSQIPNVDISVPNSAVPQGLPMSKVKLLLILGAWL